MKRYPLYNSTIVSEICIFKFFTYFYIMFILLLYPVKILYSTGSLYFSPDRTYTVIWTLIDPVRKGLNKPLTC